MGGLISRWLLFEYESAMSLNKPEFDPAECLFKWRGTKICYLSRGWLRLLAKDLGVSPEGRKIDIYRQIMRHIEENGAQAGVENVTNI